MSPFPTTNGLCSDDVPGIWDPSSPPPLDVVDEAGSDEEEEDDDEEEDEYRNEYGDYDEYEDTDPAIIEWKETRKPVHPCVPEFEDIDYAPHAKARLAHKFKEMGLQVIVKMTSIELTPEKPEIPTGEYHVSHDTAARACCPLA
jgi:hypothetical protein